MRFVFVLACVTAMTMAPALACPRNVRCLVQQEVVAASEAPRTRPAPRIPDVRRVQRVAPRSRITFEAPKRLADGEIEMPWIWQAVRERVVSKMPRYDEDKRFTLVLSPVVVTTPSDTIPGLGVAGDF